MRVTREIAENVSKALLKNKKEAIEIMEKELAEKATHLADSKIDNKLMTAFEKHKMYFCTTETVKFNAIINDTHQFIQISIGKELPRKSEGSWVINLTVEDSEFLNLEDLKKKIEKARETYSKSLEIVQETIYGLRTYKSVEQNFPEAFELLPKSTNGTMLPMLDLEKVRSLVK